jgi:predicted ATPase
MVIRTPDQWRLALAVGERLSDRFDEVVFVPLETATRPAQVLARIARAVGTDLAGTDSPLQVLVEQLAGRRWLLILDNLEQVLDGVGDRGSYWPAARACRSWPPAGWCRA